VVTSVWSFDNNNVTGQQILGKHCLSVVCAMVDMLQSSSVHICLQMPRCSMGLLGACLTSTLEGRTSMFEQYIKL